MIGLALLVLLALATLLALGWWGRREWRRTDRELRRRRPYEPPDDERSRRFRAE